jgi:hypothetical protein
MDFFILIVILAILLYVVLYFLKKKPIQEGFTLVGSDYDYLAPVDSNAISDDLWTKFVNKYNVVNSATITVETAKTNYNTNITEDEINSFIQNDHIPSEY